MYIARHSGAYLFVCMCVSTVFMGVGVISLWPPPSMATSTLLSSSCFLLAQMCIPEFVLGHLEQQLHGTPLIGYKASCPTRTWCAWWGAPIAGCVSACWYSLIYFEREREREWIKLQTRRSYTVKVYIHTGVNSRSISFYASIVQLTLWLATAGWYFIITNLFFFH